MKNLILLTFIFCITQRLAIAQNSKIATDTTSSKQYIKKENKITGSFEMNYLRHYLWRGALFGNNDVAQPELELTYKNFSIILAQNLNYIPKNVPKEFYKKEAFFDEQDVSIKFAKEWSKFSTEFQAMAYFYFYQIGSPNTAELYNWSSYKIHKKISLFTENSIDFVSYKGAIYSNSGITYSTTLKNNFSLEWNNYIALANKKFNTIYYGTGKSGINLAGTHLEVTKELGKYFLKLIGEKNFYLANDIKESTGLSGTNNFGLAAGFNF
jgi:hypothetical protein